MITNKLLYAVLVLTILPIQSFAGWLCDDEYRMSSAKDCMITDRCWPKADTIFFCGNINHKSCTNDEANDIKNIWDGQSVDWHGQKYWCCGGKEGKLGTFKQGEKGTQTLTTDVEKDGKVIGTCTYTVSICDSDEDKKKAKDNCKTVTCPNKGEIFREVSKECVPACPDGQIFKSAKSNACISEDECVTTASQGISKDGTYCDQCTAAQVYIPQKQQCVDKTSLKSYSTQQTQNCWLCDRPNDFKACLDSGEPDSIASCNIKGNGEKTKNTSKNNYTGLGLAIDSTAVTITNGKQFMQEMKMAGQSIGGAKPISATTTLSSGSVDRIVPHLDSSLRSE